MIVEASGTAVRGRGDASMRIARAMENAFIRAVEAGINDPDELGRLKVAARIAMKDKIASENAAQHDANGLESLLLHLQGIKNVLEPRMTQNLIGHVDAIERTLNEMKTDALRRASPLS